MKQSRYNEWLSSLCTREQAGMNRRRVGRKEKRGEGSKGTGSIRTKRKRMSAEKVNERKREKERKGGWKRTVRRVVGKLKLFPDSEWKHFVAAPAVLSEFLRLPLPRHIALVAGYAF